MEQVWENLTGNWQIFLAEPVQEEEQAEEPAQDEEQAGEQAQHVPDEEQDQPVEEEANNCTIH